MAKEVLQKNQTPLKTNPKTLGKLVSRLNHPVVIAYNGEGLVLAPRGTAKKIDKNLLGAIPKGVNYVQV